MTDFQLIRDPKLLSSRKFTPIFLFSRNESCSDISAKSRINRHKDRFSGNGFETIRGRVEAENRKSRKTNRFRNFFRHGSEPEKQTRHCFGNVHFAVSWSFVLNWHLAEA